MIQRFFYTGIIFFGGLFFSAPALADSNTISVTATVLEARVIYVDSSGDVQKVAGNTDSNIMPIVSQNGQIVSIIPKVSEQYKHLLAEYGGRLQAGQTYYAVSYRPYRQLATWLISNPVFNSKLY